MSEKAATKPLVSPLEIVVIGAGLGGLTAARCAQLAGFNVAIYERDPAVNSGEYQGGATDLHPRIGLWALKKAKLDVEEGRLLAKNESRSAKFADKNGRTIVESIIHRPEINRGDLRRMLASSLTPGTVKWGYDLIRVQVVLGHGENGREQIVLHYNNGRHSTLTNGLLIGADGACVRTLLTPCKPLYTGVSVVELSISNVAERYPAIATKVGGRSLQVYADSKAIIAQLHPNGTLHIHLAFRRFAHEGDVLFALGFDANAEAKRAFLASKFDGWADCWLDMIRSSDDNVFIERPVTALPAGDAAHLMPPFSGVGGDLAVRDAVSLIELLVRERNKAAAKSNRLPTRGNNDWLLAAIRQHETKMRRRARFERYLTNALMTHTLISPHGERNIRLAAPVMRLANAFGGLAARIFPRATD